MSRALAVGALVAGVCFAPGTVDAIGPGGADAATAPRAAQRGRGISPAYVAQRERWHQRPPRRHVRTWLEREPPPLVLRPVWNADRFEVTPDRAGRFSARALAVAGRALAWRRDGSTHPVHPRLLELVYRAVREFRAPWVTVVSGYRGARPTSRHAQGRAIDLVLPGVPDNRLAGFLRRQGFVGVGVYPVSGFVHLDVRERSFFWVDGSGPGQRSRTRPTLPGHAIRYDAQAHARGELSVPDIEGAERAGE